MFQIIISPAKKMNVDTDSFAINGMPQFLKDTLTELNFQRFRNMDLEHRLTPAVMAYDVWQEKKNYGKVSMGVV